MPARQLPRTLPGEPGQHLLSGVLFLLFNSSLLTPYFLHSHKACGQSLPKLLHNLLQQMVITMGIHPLLVLRAQEGVL